MNIEGVPQSERLVAVLYFPCIPWRDCSYKIRIYDTGLQEVDRGMIEVVLKPVWMEIVIRSVQTYSAQKMLTRHALMPHVVHRIANPGMRHPELFVNFGQQNRDYPCLPVVTMNNVWMPVCLQHELKRCPAEKGKPFRVVMMPVIDAPAEDISPEWGSMKKHFLL